MKEENKSNKNSNSNNKSKESELDSINSLIENKKENNSLINEKKIKKSQKRTALHANINYILKYSNLSDEQFFKKGLEIFKNQNRNFNENQVVIDFLMNLNPFAQEIKEVKKENVRDIFSSLSYTLKHKFIEKNNIIYKYDDDIDNFYLIIKGKVNILVPNEEYIKLNQIEYFLYLLNLRKYNEKALLIKTLNKNNDMYPMNEKSFDIWIKRAYLTIIKYNSKMNNKYKEVESKIGSIIRKSLFNNKNKIHQNKNYSPNKKIHILSKNYLSNSLKNIIPFETKDEIDFVLNIQNQIIETFQFISKNKIIKNFFQNFEKKYEKISCEDYIKRIKPIKIENDKSIFSIEKKDILVSSYIIAESLKEGEKFGEGLSDINYYNNNKRIETVITLEDTDFGYYNMILFNDNLKEISEKTRKEKMKFLLSLTLFKNNDQYNNLRNYTNYFKRKICKYKDILYFENDSYEKNHFIYFIQKGEFETKSNKSLYEIDQILNRTSYKNKLSNVNNIEDLKEYYIKREIKLETFGVNDIIGLSDCVYNNKLLFTISCKSNHSIIYQINVTFFKMLLNISPNIEEKLIKSQKVKNDIILNLFYKQREYAMEYIKIKYNEMKINNSNQKLKYNEINCIKKISRPFSANNNHNNNQVFQREKNKKYISSEGNLFYSRINSKGNKESKNYMSSKLSYSNSKNYDIDIILRNETTINTSRFNQSNILNSFNNYNYNNFNTYKKKNILYKRSKNKYEKEFKKKLIEKDKKLPLKLLTTNNSQLNNLHSLYQNDNYFNNTGNFFLNPLVYDDFDRKYNTLRYFKPSKKNIKEPLIRLDISSAIRRKKKIKLHLSQERNKNHSYDNEGQFKK